MKNTSIKELYLENDFAAASKALKQQQNEFDSGWYFYNLGTIELKAGNLPQARFYLEKSLKEGFHLAEAKHNLKVAKQKFITEERPQEFFPLLYQQILSIPSPALLTGILLMTLALAVMRLLKKLLMKVFLCSLVLLGSLFLGHFFLVNSYEQAVILQKGEILEGPSQIFAVSHEAPLGLKVWLKKQKNEWRLITYPEKYAGWVHINDLGLL